jgi:hypothetical protein
MSSVLVKAVETLGPNFLFLVVLIILAMACYFLPKVRRDKNGKLYIFSRSYEMAKVRQKEGDAKLSKLCSEINGLKPLLRELDQKTQQLAILENIHHTPKAVMVIEKQLDEYFKAGYDGFIHDVAKTWKEEYAAAELHDRI